jgi:hypothetical protein
MPEVERGHATRMRDTLAAMGSLGPEVSALVEFGGALSAIGSIAQASGEMPAGFYKLETTFGELAGQVLVRADRIPQSVTADGTVGAYLRACCPEVPAPGKDVVPSVMARAAWRVPTAFHHLYMLALGELVDLCERAEKARGIRPIRLWRECLAPGQWNHARARQIPRTKARTLTEVPHSLMPDSLELS